MRGRSCRFRQTFLLRSSCPSERSTKLRDRPSRMWLQQEASNCRTTAPRQKGLSRPPKSELRSRDYVPAPAKVVCRFVPSLRSKDRSKVQRAQDISSTPCLLSWKSGNSSSLHSPVICTVYDLAAG